MAAFTFTFTPTHASWLNRGLLFQAGALDAPAYPRRPRNTNSRSAYWPLSTTSIVNRSSTVGATKSTMRPDRIGPLYWKHRTSPRHRRRERGFAEGGGRPDRRSYRRRPTILRGADEGGPRRCKPQHRSGNIAEGPGDAARFADRAPRSTRHDGSGDR